MTAFTWLTLCALTGLVCGLAAYGITDHDGLLGAIVGIASFGVALLTWGLCAAFGKKWTAIVQSQGVDDGTESRNYSEQ